MSERIYPALRYHQNPKMTPRVVNNEDEDRRLEPEFDDPYALRTRHIQEPPQKRAGRPRKAEQ